MRQTTTSMIQTNDWFTIQSDFFRRPRDYLIVAIIYTVAHVSSTVNNDLFGPFTWRDSDADPSKERTFDFTGNDAPSSQIKRKKKKKKSS